MRPRPRRRAQSFTYGIDPQRVLIEGRSRTTPPPRNWDRDHQRIGIEDWNGR